MLYVFVPFVIQKTKILYKMFTFFLKKKHYVKNVDQILFLQPLRVEEHKRKNVNNEPTTWCHTFRIKIKKQNIIFSRLTSFFFLNSHWFQFFAGTNILVFCYNTVSRMCECARSFEGHNDFYPTSSQDFFVSATTDTASWNWLNFVGIEN